MPTNNPTVQKRGFFARMFGRKQPEQSQQGNRRNFAGAGRLGALQSWQPQNWSADALAQSDLDRLRARARSLARDNDYMRKFLQMVESNIIGREGFALQMRVPMDNRNSPDSIANRAIETAFYRWARRSVCDVTGLLSFADLQRLLVRSVARDGEALVRHIWGFGNDYGYALQVLDIDRLDTGFSRDRTDNLNAVRMGVELNEYSRPVAYWLRTSHPGERGQISSSPNLRERVPADEISHIYLHDRPEQRRGFPWVASAIVGLQNLGGYQEAAIIAARIGASKMGFFKQTEESDSFMPPIDGQEVNNGHGGVDLIDTVEPGTFHELPQGYDFTPFNPDYPHANYDAFVKASLRGLASGLGVSYHSLANDLEGVNFSSIRSGTLEERDAWMSLQNWFAESFLYDVFDRWIESALLMGAIKLPSGKALPPAKLDKFKNYQWQGRRWSWVDPLKDIKTHEAAVSLAVKSRRDICAEMGLDFDDVLAQIEQENVLMAEKGIISTVSNSAAAVEETPNDETQ